MPRGLFPRCLTVSVLDPRRLGNVTYFNKISIDFLQPQQQQKKALVPYKVTLGYLHNVDSGIYKWKELGYISATLILCKRKLGTRDEL